MNSRILRLLLGANHDDDDDDEEYDDEEYEWVPAERVGFGGVENLRISFEWKPATAVAVSRNRGPPHILHLDPHYRNPFLGAPRKIGLSRTLEFVGLR